MKRTIATTHVGYFGCKINGSIGISDNDEYIIKLSLYERVFVNRYINISFDTKEVYNILHRLINDVFLILDMMGKCEIATPLEIHPLVSELGYSEITDILDYITA